MSFLSSLVPFQRREQSPAVADSKHLPVREPVYRVSEADDAYAVTVFLPGVSREALQVTAEQDVITLRAERRWQAPNDWETLYQESADQVFELRLRHDDSVDVEKINAELRDGVLKLTLPKAEAVKPRRIAIN